MGPAILTSVAARPVPGGGEQTVPDERPLVLLVDGDQELMELLEEVVSGEGYRTARTSPAELYSALRIEDRVALIILDAELTTDPQHGAWQALRPLRDDPATASIPVLVTSADTRLLREQAPEIDRLEGVAILGKPFSVDDLLRAMQAAIHGTVPPARSNTGR